VRHAHGLFLTLAALTMFGLSSLAAETAPRFAFRDGKVAAEETRPLRTSPDGRIRLEIGGRRARLIDTTTGKPVGKVLDAGTLWTERHEFTFMCWSFSPDGKAVATGSRFYEESGSHGHEKTHVGRVQVWDAVTGGLLVQSAGRMGGVSEVAFSRNSRTVVYRAAPYEIDGP
jgi:hypothetical protein